MQLFRNAVLVTNRQPIAFKCRACGVCCKNVRDSIVLEPLDAYRIVRDKQKNGCTDSADDILWNMAELKELSPGFHVFVLRTVNDSGMCGMLRDDRCTIYSVRPHTCRLYPSAYGGALPGGASYQVVFVYGAAPSLWLRLRHCTGMAKKKYVR